MGKRDKDVRCALGVSAEMLLALRGIADEIEGQGGDPESIRYWEKDEQLRRIIAKATITSAKLAEIIRQAKAETARLAAEEAKKAVASILKLSHPFNPAEFIGSGCTVWKGPKDGSGLEGDEDRDSREDGLTEIDFSQAVFETCLAEGETSITGEEKLNRLKTSGKLRLAGKTAVALWLDYQADKENSILEYLHHTKRVIWFELMGVVLRDPDGERYCPFFYRDGGGLWHWSYSRLDDRRFATAPSAELAS